MSEEPSLGLRLKKKLKLAVGKAPGRKNFDRRTRDGDTIAGTGSVEKAARKAKLRPATAHVKRQRIYGGQDSDVKVTPFTDVATHRRKSLSRRRNDAEVVGKSRDESLNHASLQGKFSLKKQENGVRSPKVSYEKGKIREGKDYNVESTRKRFSKNTIDSSKTLDSTENKSWGVTPDPAKRRVFKKRSANGDPELLIDQPKKRKRVIRLDPYDLSNKRLDDGIITGELISLPQFPTQSD